MPKRIMIVDDSDKVRSSLRKYLERELGLQVCGEAVDGIDALEKIAFLAPDLVLLDLAMPRMNGLQAAREFRNVPVGVPIILFTMHSDELRIQDAKAAGINAVVAKTNLADLKQNIENLLQLN